MNSLPIEVKLTVLEYLDIPERLRIRSVSRQMNTLVNDRQLWKGQGGLPWLPGPYRYRLDHQPFYLITHNRDCLGVFSDLDKPLDRILHREDPRRVKHEYSLVVGEPPRDIPTALQFLKNYLSERSQELDWNDQLGFLCDRYYVGYVIQKIKLDRWSDVCFE